MLAEKMPLLGTLPSAAAAPGPLSSGPLAPGASGTGMPRLPLNIGHRGYKAAFPENSLAAFDGAVAAGAHAIETDLHLSRDGVVVLSHDASLKRCFGIDKLIADCDWEYLRTLETLRAPAQGMPCLADLLEWLNCPERESVWVVLDIKTDDDPDVLLPAIASTLEAVKPVVGGREWRERIIVGGWNKHYIDLTSRYLPGFQRIYIGPSPLYALKFLSPDYGDVHFNLFQPSLIGPVGARFRRAVRAAGRALLVWTVNDEHWMEWCIRKRETVDGVITDQVEVYRDVRRRHGEEDEEGEEEEAGKGRVVVAKRRGGGLVRRLRMYMVGFLMQAGSVLVVVLMWHRLSSKGKGGKGKVESKLVPGKTT